MAAFTTGGDVSWVEQSSVVYNGPTAWECPIVDNTQEAWIETTLTGPGVYTFALRFEDYWDLLKIYRNGVKQASPGTPSSDAAAEWNEYSLEIASGTHTIRWIVETSSTTSNSIFFEWIQDPVDPGYTEKTYTTTEINGDWTSVSTDIDTYIGAPVWQSPSGVSNSAIEFSIPGQGWIQVAVFRNDGYAVRLEVNGDEVSTDCAGYQFFNLQTYAFGASTGEENKFRFVYEGSDMAKIAVLHIADSSTYGIPTSYADSFENPVLFFLESDFSFFTTERFLDSFWHVQTSDTYSSSTALVNGDGTAPEKLSVYARMRVYSYGPWRLEFAGKVDLDTSTESANETCDFSMDPFNSPGWQDDESYLTWTEGTRLVAGGLHCVQFIVGKGNSASFSTAPRFYLDLLSIYEPTPTSIPVNGIEPEIITGGDGEWIESTETYIGGVAYESPYLSYGKFSTLGIYVNGPAFVKFAWKAGDFDNCDFGFYYDRQNFPVITLSKNSVWEEMMIEISDYGHTLYWRIESNTSSSYTGRAHVEILGGAFTEIPPSISDPLVLLEDFAWPSLVCEGFHILGVQSDGSVSVSGTYETWIVDPDPVQTEAATWTGIEKIFAIDENQLLAIDNQQITDGFLYDSENYQIKNEPVISCCIFGEIYDSNRMLFLSSNGRVSVKGETLYLYQEMIPSIWGPVKAWRDIIKISAGGTGAILGLRTDGTLWTCGIDSALISNTPTGSDFIDIIAGHNHFLALHSDGTVSAWGSDNADGELDVGSWSNVVQVMAESNNSYGLKADGTVYHTGQSAYGESNVTTWTDIVYIDSRRTMVAGLKSDGTVVAEGDDQYMGSYTTNAIANVSNLTGIVIPSNAKKRPVCLKEENIGILDVTLKWDWVYNN